MKNVAATDGPLPVLFRKLKPFRGDPGGEVEALFPTEPDVEFQRRLDAGDARMFVAGFNLREGHVSADLRVAIGIEQEIPIAPRHTAGVRRSHRR